MLFTSYGFIAFLCLLFVAYYFVPKRWQWGLLLAASYIFYAFAGWQCLIFIAVTTVSAYAVARLMARMAGRESDYLAAHRDSMDKEARKAYKAKAKKRRFGVLLCGLVLNFGILAVLKYTAFAVFNLNSALTAFGAEPLGIPDLLLPMGISFYIFQTMGYLIDVYRGKTQAEENFFRLALFVSFFPQLVQGPISRHGDLAAQLYAPHAFDARGFTYGLQRILWGYFKKLVIADRIAVAVGALKAPEYTGVGFFILTVFYAVQIYADFTGGIDVTVGLSQTLGITLPENFIRPYFSKNIAEYWRRWHITLGEWMKDYIFYPISISKPMLKLSKAARAKLGNVGKRLPVYVASVATWFVTGIWHGLTPNFVLWGMLNCFVIVVSEELTPLYSAFHNRFHLKEKKWYGGFEILRMFLLMNLIRVCDLFPRVGDYFFRMGSLVTVWNFHMLRDGTLLQLGLSGLDYGILAVSVVLVFAVSLLQEKKGSVRELLWTRPALRYSLMFLLLLAVLLMGSYGIGYEASSFIYNQF